MAAGVPETHQHRHSPSEVARLPVGTIVYPWVRDRHSGPMGRVDGSPLIVIPGGNITQVALLPERANGGEPGGDPPQAFAHEFVVVDMGRGRLPTKGVAQRAAMNWLRANPDLQPMT